MSKKIINRKTFLKYGSIILTAPVMFSLSGCSNISGLIIVENNLNDTIKKMASFTVSPDLKKSNNENIYQIPGSCIDAVQGKIFIVYKIIYKRNDIFLRSQNINLLKQENYFAYVQGINVGDVLLINPRQAIQEMKKTDKIELKRKFEEGK